MKSIFVGFMVLLFSMSFAVAAKEKGDKVVPTVDKRGIVVQVTDDNKLNMALTNAINTRALMPTTEIEVIVYGPAINMLKSDTPAAGKIDAAREKYIHVIACEESMKNFKITKADMYRDMEYVPFGLEAIVKRQFGGWAYARP